MTDPRRLPNVYQSQDAEDDPLDFSNLLFNIEEAPTTWLRSTIAHLELIHRADLIIGAPDWHLAVLHDQADRAMDALLIELSERITADRS